MMNKEYPKMYLYKRIVQAKLFIDAHYAENIDVSNIANEAWFSKFHFIRLFRSVYGKTPHHYLRQVRVEQAKLLLQKNLPVLEVSCLVGFDSATSFTALFKRLTGITPSDYQQRHRARSSSIAANPLRAVPHCFAESSGWVEK